MKYSYRLKPAAARDIVSICDYITQRNPQAAEKLKNNILKNISLLESSPNIGIEAKRKFDADIDYLILIVKPYIIFYKVESPYINIYRVLDGRSDYLVALELAGHTEIDGDNV